MDPNIMKLLEDDEDDTMHSGADVEAFAAALNRDLGGGAGGGGGDASSASRPPEPAADTGLLPHGNSSTSNQLPTQLQDSNQEGNINTENKDEVKNSQPQDVSAETEMMQHGVGSENHNQCVGSSQDSKNIKLESQHKHEQFEQQAEQKHQLSQKSGFQVSEQNSSHLGELDRTQKLENQQQYPKSQKMENQQMPAAEPESRNKQVAFGMLLPEITPQLDKDRAMQLQTLYSKLRKNEIQKDGFVRHMRTIVGDQMLRQAVQKIQTQQEQTKGQSAQNLQTASHQRQAQSQSSSQPQQQVNMSSLNASQFKDSQAFLQLHQKGHRIPVPADPTPNVTVKIEAPSGSSFPNREGDAQKRDEHKSDSQGVQVNQVSSSNMGAGNQDKVPAIQGLNKHQQQHLRPPQTSYPMYGAHMTNYHPHPYSGQSVGISSTSLKPQAQDTQVRQVSLHQGITPTQLGGATQSVSSMNAQNYEIHNSSAESKRPQAGQFSQLTTQSTLQNTSVTWQSSAGNDRKGTSTSSVSYIKQEAPGQSQEQHISQIPASSSSTSFVSGKIDQGNPAPPITNSIPVSMPTQLDSLLPVRSQVSSTTTSLGPGTNIKTPPKKLSIGQKRPFDASGTPSSANKKSKNGAFLKVDQLNDVTTVSGVDLREEEEQLFSGPKEESRVSEAARRVVQEEEEKLILEKAPFHKKLANIMSNCGIKSANKDVERCLSLCVEERIRGIISNLIRVSKKRADYERQRHPTIVTSDVRRQLLDLNQKSKEDLEKKQAEEAGKLRKINETDGNAGGDDDKDKDEGRTKPIKANKEEDEKMKTTAANVAARVAVGGDDMLSKWQLMAEQARQKREGMDSASVNQTGKDLSRKSSSTTGRASRETQDGDNRSTSTVAKSGTTKKFGRNPTAMPHAKVVTRTISVKDMIAVLEREPQTSKSRFLYRLFERNGSSARTSE